MQPLDQESYLRCDNVCIALMSSMVYHKVHVSMGKSRGPNYLRPFKDPWPPDHGTKVLVEFCNKPTKFG